MATCKRCRGMRWVCENHPDMALDHPDGCSCGAGDPCPDCNGEWGEDGPAMPPGFTPHDRLN
jgi:hypothetical protein